VPQGVEVRVLSPAQYGRLNAGQVKSFLETESFFLLTSTFELFTLQKILTA
jgi:hypothetical protein